MALLTALLLAGCHNVPRGESAVDRLKVEGAAGRQKNEIKEGIATRQSPRLLGVFNPGFVFEYELYDEGTLNRDIERIERLMRRRGFYEAKVRAARVVRLDENRVRVEIEVHEGERVLLRKVDIRGLAQLPFDASVAALRANPMRADQIFDEDDFEEAKVELSNALADAGYAHVRTRGSATVDLRAHRADVSFDIEPGPSTRYGTVSIEGLRELPERPIRSALSITRGRPYSRAELELARGALVDLGVFSKVEVIPDLSDPSSTNIPILVRVEESPKRSITAGVGVTLDVLRLAATSRIGWSHLNFFGGLRKFTISTRPTLTFFPTRVDNFVWPTRILPENSLLMGLEQPSFIEGRTRGFINTGYNVYPLLYPLPADALPEEQRIIGYNELTASFGVRRNFFGRHLPVTLSMNYRANFPFTYQGSLQDICGATTDGDACGLEPVVVAFPELTTDLDLRDDPISPTKGFFLSNSLQIAIPALGGQLADVRIRPEARAYVPLDYGHKLILAARATFGLVFPQNYGEALTNPSDNTPDSELIRDQHRLLFRAFYSGGPQSNRGYPFQRIGPQGAIGFLVPTGVNCDDPTNLSSSCILPLGGFSLWEASLELRWRFSPPWGLVLFVDASDVNPGIASFTFTTPHISVGPGLRYMSPIGPVRVDLGFRVPGLQKLTSTPEDPPDISEIEPYSSERWDQAFALQVLIGEAF